MARKKTSIHDSPPYDSDRNGLDRNGLDELTSTVPILAQEVRVLREAIDELRELLDWTMRNREAPASNDHPRVSVANVPGDLVSDDVGEKTNPTPADHISHEEEPSAAAPGELF